jgi:DNA-binding IclR family transcriptional regulator
MLVLNADRHVAALVRLTTEYHDLPGLRLTSAQAARLCNLSLSDANDVLTVLVTSGVLFRDGRGQYALTLRHRASPEPRHVEAWRAIA